MDKNQVAVSIFNKFAKSYEVKYMDVSMYHKSFDLFCTALKNKSSTVLELACGPGNVSKYILNNRADLKLLGFDLSEEMVKLAQLNNPTAHFDVFDCRELLSLTNQYDGIMCAFLFPYLSKEESIELIANASTKLNSDGIFYISTMEDKYDNSCYQKGNSGDEIFMHFHEADYLIEALEENGLNLLLTERIITKNEDGSQVTDLILIASKA